MDGEVLSDRDFQKGESLWQEGRSEWKKRHFSEAIEKFKEASLVTPQTPVIYKDWAAVLDLLGRHDEALQQVEKAIELNRKHSVARDPEYHEAHYLKGLLLLAKGKYEEGWQEYKWLYRSRLLFPFSKFGIRLWDGCQKKTTGLLYSDQGIGDAIQFARYIPMLKQYFKRIIFLGDANVATFLHARYGFNEVVTHEGLANKYRNDPRSIKVDCLVPLSILPCRFRTFVQGEPPPAPYLEISQALVAELANQVAQGAFKVGIVWTGNPDSAHHQVRSIPTAQFGQLLLPGVHLYSLQKESTEADFAWAGQNDPVHNLAAQMQGAGWTLNHTAAVIRNLHLVVACDSMVAHLAGALGCRVWLALPVASEWRWALGVAETPWYSPNMRIFRQTAFDDWNTVFHELGAALEELL
jgi:hypothetical protein